MFLATLGAGFARTFYELLVAACVIGLAEGFSLSAVRDGIPREYIHRDVLMNINRHCLCL